MVLFFGFYERCMFSLKIDFWLLQPVWPISFGSLKYVLLTISKLWKGKIIYNVDKQAIFILILYSVFIFFRWQEQGHSASY